MKTLTKQTLTQQEKIGYEWRDAIFNQIYTTRYYHVRLYKFNPVTGKWSPTKTTRGHRGSGGHLGYTSRAEAISVAAELNSQL